MPQDTPKFAYLRHRPYLAVEFYKVPSVAKGAGRVHTERKGWLDNQANVSVNEHPRIVERVSDKIMQGSGIIIDLLEDKVIKNGFAESNDTVLAHFMKKYASIIEQGRSQWINSMVTEFDNFEDFKRSIRVPSKSQVD